MNRSSDVELALREWLAEDHSAMPDRVVEAVADRIARQPQRRASRLYRRLQMNSYLKLVAGLAAAILVAVVGWNLLPKQPAVGGSSPTPIVTPAPTPTATAARTARPIACDNGSAGCAGPLEPGSHTSANFKPTLTYVVPAGWTNSFDLTRTYKLVPQGAAYSFGVLSEVAIPEQTPDCKAVAKVGVGNTVADWVTFLTKHPGLVAQAPVAVTIGGYSGFSVRFARADSWTQTCPGSIGPAVTVVMHPGSPTSGDFFVDDQQVTYTILDVGGETVIINIDSAPSPAAHTADLLKAQPIIDSITFIPPG